MQCYFLLLLKLIFNSRKNYISYILRKNGEEVEIATIVIIGPLLAVVHEMFSYFFTSFERIIEVYSSSIF